MSDFDSNGSSVNSAVGASRAVAGRMADMASDWLVSLDDAHRAVAQWAAPGRSDEAERRLWFYTPTDHGGLPLTAQTDSQQRKAMRLVSTGLSPEGYNLLSLVMGHENILDYIEGFTSSFDTERGRDPGRYYLAIFGTPQASGSWAWRFGGHHISLNYLIRDGEVRSTTPHFFGLDPAASALPGGKTLAPLEPFETAARDLLTTLDDTERAAAVLLDRAPVDIVGGNRPQLSDGATVMELPRIFRRRSGDSELVEYLAKAHASREAEVRYTKADHEKISFTFSPKGLPASAMSTPQVELLKSLVAVHTSTFPPALRPLIPTGELSFAWAGALEAGFPSYYRIQGADNVIEWDNTARSANHAHAAFRNVINDFGVDALRDHRRVSHPVVRSLGSPGRSSTGES